MLQSCYWWWHDLEHIGTNGRLYIVDVMPSLKSHKSRLILFIPTIASPFHCCQPSISDLLHLPDLQRSTYALRASARGLRHIPRPAPVRRPPGLAVDDAAETARFAPRHLYPDERDEPVVVVRTVPRLVFVGWTDKIDLSTPFYPPFPRSTPKDNVMWNCQSLIDQGVIDYIQSISRLKAINYTKSLPSSRTRTFTIHALNGAKLCVYISAADKRASGYPVYCLVEGDTLCGVGISHGLIDSAYLRYPSHFSNPPSPPPTPRKRPSGPSHSPPLLALGPWSPGVLPLAVGCLGWSLTAHGSSAPCGATSLGRAHQLRGVWVPSGAGVKAVQDSKAITGHSMSTSAVSAPTNAKLTMREVANRSARRSLRTSLIREGPFILHETGILQQASPPKGSQTNEQRVHEHTEVWDPASVLPHSLRDLGELIPVK
ncbi:hypothetical protein BC936DRAFT_146334 [Jimgerdemannia flammicorona]|uniref:Uncharacterized protein n=1 Tax=Jimgerdemannia flammicorona TaxID=994334 RepID=A0A433D7W8_9FUNG|nr:hypothetical protein BC936DRAFT_146334 [Jimgerdemannia flammicorona]